MRKLLKPLAIFACAVVLVAGTVAGTLAYLTSKTNTITNTFTVGDVSITLEETTATQLKMIPGMTIDKDPKVTVKKDSEDCWLFVKLDESTGFNTYLTYTIDANVWTKLDDEVGVYYRQVAASNADQVFNVIAGNTVTANNVSKKEYDQLKKDGNYSYPTLSVSAFAIQLAGFADAAAAWEAVCEAYPDQTQNPS